MFRKRQQRELPLAIRRAMLPTSNFLKSDFYMETPKESLLWTAFGNKFKRIRDGRNLTQQDIEIKIETFFKDPIRRQRLLDFISVCGHGNLKREMKRIGAFDDRAVRWWESGQRRPRRWLISLALVVVFELPGEEINDFLHICHYERLTAEEDLVLSTFR